MEPVTPPPTYSPPARSEPPAGPRIVLALALAMSLLFNACSALGWVVRDEPRPEQPKIIRESGPTTTTTECDAACRGWTPARTNALFLALRKQYGDDKTALCVTTQLLQRRAEDVLAPATEYQQAQAGANSVNLCSTFVNGTSVYPAAPALGAVKP